MDDSRTQLRAKPFLHRGTRASNALRIFLAVFLLAAAQCTAPAGQQGIPDQVSQRPQNPFGDIGNDDPVFAEKRARALNEERQKNMVSDAGKLLKLATELNSDVDSGSPASFTPEQVRKIAEIEKLAHSVKEKMSYAVDGAPSFREPPPPPIR